MAKIADGFPKRTIDKGGSNYDKYLDGQVWVLEQGEDFKCSLESARASLISRSKSLGGKARTQKTSSTTLYVQWIA